MKFKEKLEILKYNFQCMKVDYQLNESFIVEKLKVFECYNITQNIDSLPLLFHSFGYPNAQTYFFVELFNFYQNLPLYEDYPYRSFSQSITTYCLKEMERRGLISIVKQFKGPVSPYLRKCMELFGNFQYRREEVSMYHVYFYKLRSFNNQDISFLQDMAKILSIAISDLKFVCDEEEMTIQLEQNCTSYGNILKKLWLQRKNIAEISSSYFDYLIGDDFKRVHRK